MILDLLTLLKQKNFSNGEVSWDKNEVIFYFIHDTNQNRSFQLNVRPNGLYDVAVFNDKEILRTNTDGNVNINVLEERVLRVIESL